MVGGLGRVGVVALAVGRAGGPLPIIQGPPRCVVLLQGAEPVSSGGNGARGRPEAEAKPPTPTASSPSPTSASASSEVGGGDAALLDAVLALRDGRPEDAQALLEAALAAYDSAGGPTADQAAMAAQLRSRLRPALQRARDAKAGRPAALGPPEGSLARAAVRRDHTGDRLAREALAHFEAGDLHQARDAIVRARAAFDEVGAVVRRDREPQLSTLWSLVAREEERRENVERLLRLKKLRDEKKRRNEGDGGLGRPQP